MYWGNRVTVSLRQTFLILIGVFMMFPFLWIFLTSIKEPVQIFSIPPQFIPKPITFKNYIDLFRGASIYVYVKKGAGINVLALMTNSIIVSLSATLIAFVVGVLAAYSFARYRYRGSKAIFTFIVAIRMFPIVILVIPYFLMMSNLKLLNTKLALIIAYFPIELSLMVWLLEGFFRQFPREIEEAAEIDGAGTILKLVKIILPVSLPSISVAVFFGFLFSWNEFMIALTLTRNYYAQTMPVGLASYITLYQIDWGKLTANSVLFALPAIIFTIMAQKGLVKGLVVGALK